MDHVSAVLIGWSGFFCRICSLRTTTAKGMLWALTSNHKHQLPSALCRINTIWFLLKGQQTLQPSASHPRFALRSRTYSRAIRCADLPRPCASRPRLFSLREERLGVVLRNGGLHHLPTGHAMGQNDTERAKTATGFDPRWRRGAGSEERSERNERALVWDSLDKSSGRE